LKCVQDNGLPDEKGDLMTADNTVKTAVGDGILGSVPSEARLRSTGKFTVPLVDRSPRLTAATGLILDEKNCAKVYNEHRMEGSLEFFGVPCSAHGFNTFSHMYVGMAFATPIQNEFNLQVKAALYSPNDGGSEFGIETMGIKISVYNHGYLGVSGDHNQFIGSKLKLDRSAAQEEHKYVFRFLFSKRRIDLVLNDDGNFRTNPALSSWNLPDYIPMTLSKVSWKIGLYQNVVVPSIEILPAPASPDSQGDVFENWKEKNQSGVNYVSAPNENCRTGYRSIFLDSASHRRECESIPAYYPKAGEQCGQDFLKLEVSGRPICQNSRIYPQYWPLQGDQCAPGYSDVGIEPGTDHKMWRSCVDTTRVSRYVIHNLKLHCDPGFKEKAESWNTKKWITCTR
jgi:hypothetical protein